MAERRMFSKAIVSSDAFLDMPFDAQALYFQLCMASDDDGFVQAPRSVMRSCGASNDAMKLLAAKKFVLTFNKGDDFIFLIKHWRVNNYIQKDRYRASKYKEFLRELYYDENKSYSTNPGDGHTPCIQDVSKVDTQDRIEIGKDRVSLESGQDRVAGEGPQLPEYPDDNDDSYLASWKRMHPGEPVPPVVADYAKLIGGMA